MQIKIISWSCQLYYHTLPVPKLLDCEEIIDVGKEKWGYSIVILCLCDTLRGVTLGTLVFCHNSLPTGMNDPHKHSCQSKFCSEKK